MVAEDENPARWALGLDNNNKSQNIGFEAILKKHKIRLKEEAEITIIAKDLTIEKIACNNIAFIKTIAIRYKNKKHVIRIE